MGKFLRLAVTHNALKAYEFDQEQWSAANQVPQELADGVCAALVCLWMAVYQHQTKPFHFRKDTKTLVKFNWAPLSADVAYAAEAQPTLLATLAFTNQSIYEHPDYGDVTRLFCESLRGCNSPFSANINDMSQSSRQFDALNGAAWLTTPGFHIVERGSHCVGVISDQWHRDKPDPSLAARPPRPVWKFFDPNWGMATFGTSADFLAFFNEYMDSWVLMPGSGSPRVHHFYFLSSNR